MLGVMDHDGEKDVHNLLSGWEPLGWIPAVMNKEQPLQSSNVWLYTCKSRDEITYSDIAISKSCSSNACTHSIKYITFLKHVYYLIHTYKCMLTH